MAAGGSSDRMPICHHPIKYCGYVSFALLPCHLVASRVVDAAILLYREVFIVERHISYKRTDTYRQPRTLMPALRYGKHFAYFS